MFVLLCLFICFVILFVLIMTTPTLRSLSTSTPTPPNRPNPKKRKRFIFFFFFFAKTEPLLFIHHLPSPPLSPPLSPLPSSPPLPSPPFFNREGAGVVESKPFKTLIVRNVPLSVEFRDMDVLLKQQVGFDACRKVRNTYFVDFTDLK